MSYHSAKFGGPRHSGRWRYNGFRLSHDLTRPPFLTLWFGAPHLPSRFGSHRDCGSGNMLFLVEGEDSTCPRLDPRLLHISKAHGMACSRTQFQNVDTII